MMKLDESCLNDKIVELLEEVRKEIEPLRLNIYKEIGAKDIKVETKRNEEGNLEIIIYEEGADDFYISLELLGILSQKYIPNFIRVLQFDIVGNIGRQLQTYITSKWVMEQQKNIGIETDINRLMPNVEELLMLQKNPYNTITKILLVNSLIRFYPNELKKYEQLIMENCPEVLEYSKLIMESIQNNEINDKLSTKKALVNSIKQWNDILNKLGVDVGNLQLLISVTPVFKQRQMEVAASSLLKIIPRAIKDQKSKNHNHVILTLKDNQTAAHFHMEDDDVEKLMNSLNELTLSEFLKIFAIPHYIQ